MQSAETEKIIAIKSGLKGAARVPSYTFESPQAPALARKINLASATWLQNACPKNTVKLPPSFTFQEWIWIRLCI